LDFIGDHMTISFICVFFAFILIYIARIPVAIGQYNMPEGMNNKYPRDQQLNLKGIYKRANGIHINNIETFGPFAVSVIIAAIQGADANMCNNISIAFICIRVVYFVLYLLNFDTLRTLVWTAGQCCIAAIFFIACF
jgi:uncharacterized MAPEG superfamily protein